MILVDDDKTREAELGLDMSIVLVCWNNIDYLKPCLDSLYDGDLNSTYDVVVVDNGSTDGSQAMWDEKYPQVKIIQNSGKWSPKKFWRPNFYKRTKTDKSTRVFLLQKFGIEKMV